MADYLKIRKKLSEKKSLPLYEPEELKYLDKPLGKAAYLGRKTSINDDERKRKGIKANWWDRIECNICGVEFTRSARSKHNRTKQHQIYKKIDKKMRKVLLPNDNQ